MQLAGQFLAHLEHFLHLSGSIQYCMSFLQIWAGHFLSLTWASYSSGKLAIVERIGLAEVWPRAQRDPSLMTVAKYFISFKVCSVAVPFVTFWSIS